jgi:hypothetical protein
MKQEHVGGREGEKVMDSERKKAQEKGDCREIGYWNKDIDPHFKFKFHAAPVGISKHTQAQYSV